MKKSLGPKTLIYPTPVLVVGSYNADGSANIMTAAWGGVASSKPASIAVSIRSATATHGNIMQRKAFTVSIPGESQAMIADYVGLVSGREHNKIAELGLTPAASMLVDAPYASEFPLVLECRLSAVHELGMHTQFIGEIVDTKAEYSVLGEDGAGVDVTLLRPILYAMGAQAYFGLGKHLGKAFDIGRDAVSGE
jgi:flavin reductase (DIM6/NTAB) family NADH-FMN oxidoreductase RutF